MAKKTVTIKIPDLPKNKWMISTILLTIFSLFLVLRGCKITGFAVGLNKQKVGEEVIAYINDNLIPPGESVSLISVEETSDVYEIVTSYRGREITVYATKDGSLLFLGAYNLKETPTTTQPPKKSCEDVMKAEEPLLEAFVVSKCPFGLQMQRILSEIVKNIPELENNIKIEYIGSTSDGEILSMHGPEEAEENLRQICIREEQPEKFWDYISCHIKNGDVDPCLELAGVDVESLQGCMDDVNRGVAYAQVDFAQQDAYGVSGSPTLILNGERVSEFDFGGRTAEAVKTLICCGFETKPDFCSVELTTEQAAVGFSESYSSGSSGSGTC